MTDINAVELSELRAIILDWIEFIDEPIEATLLASFEIGNIVDSIETSEEPCSVTNDEVEVLSALDSIAGLEYGVEESSALEPMLDTIENV